MVRAVQTIFATSARLALTCSRILYSFSGRPVKSCELSDQPLFADVDSIAEPAAGFQLDISIRGIGLSKQGNAGLVVQFGLATLPGRAAGDDRRTCDVNRRLFQMIDPQLDEIRAGFDGERGVALGFVGIGDEDGGRRGESCRSMKII